MLKIYLITIFHLLLWGSYIVHTLMQKELLMIKDSDLRISQNHSFIISILISKIFLKYTIELSLFYLFFTFILQIFTFLNLNNHLSILNLRPFQKYLVNKTKLLLIYLLKILQFFIMLLWTFNLIHHRSSDRLIFYNPSLLTKVFIFYHKFGYQKSLYLIVLIIWFSITVQFLIKNKLILNKLFQLFNLLLTGNIQFNLYFFLFDYLSF